MTSFQQEQKTSLSFGVYRMAPRPIHPCIRWILGDLSKRVKLLGFWMWPPTYI